VHDKSDAELVALARAGDKRAFGELVERYQAMATRIALRMIAHAEIARELAQDAMLEAYLSLKHLRDDARFQQWLYGIVLNVCRSYVRDQHVQYFSLEAMLGGVYFDETIIFDPSPSPEEIIAAHELHQRVLHATATLSPSEREATLLFYYDQLTLREVAVALGISVGAVKARLHKSRLHLREKLWTLHDEQVGERKHAMRKVSIADVVKQERTNDEGQVNPFYIIMLHDAEQNRALPIWVGPYEGQAIAMGLREFSTPRPMTYNFMASLLDAAGVRVESVQIASLKDETFYATVTLRNGEKSSDVDARPSDALALALRTNGHIFVTDDVMERAGLEVPSGVTAARKGAEQIMSDLERVFQPWATHPRTPEEAEQSRKQREQTQRELIAQVFGD